MTLVAGKGILNNTRYYDTINKRTGKLNINHVSLIEREQIADHKCIKKKKKSKKEMSSIKAT